MYDRAEQLGHPSWPLLLGAPFGLIRGGQIADSQRPETRSHQL
jgi:hypothetical protein